MNMSDSDFFRLRDYMLSNYGINLEKKRALIESRLSNTIGNIGYTSFTKYVDDVLNDKSGEMITQIVSKLTTNYTYFMREDTHYKFLTNVALPEWSKKIKDHDLRIWSAGCSSGEEAYTTAMVVSEFFGNDKKNWDTTILATDISEDVLSVGKKGIYPREHLDRLPQKWKEKYFEDASGAYVKAKNELLQEVVFGRFNLMGSFSQFRKKFHVIFCRNVMIYFKNETKTELAKKYFDALEPGGYFFIGLSETLSGLDNNFTQIAPSIYRKGQ